ncbi:MAG: hypothetical protein U1F29_05160 [Planctomycetota bacterium]
MPLSRRLLVLLALSSCIAAPGKAWQGSQVLTLVSAPPGLAGPSDDSTAPTLNGDGRIVAFESFSAVFVANDTNSARDVFVLDRSTGVYERVSVGPAGQQSSSPSQSHPCSISPDGRYVTFVTSSTNFWPLPSGAQKNVFLRDRVAGTTELAALTSAGTPLNQGAEWGVTSGDGRFVAFGSMFSNLVVPGVPQSSTGHVYLRDRLLGATTVVDRPMVGAQWTGTSVVVAITPDGRYVLVRTTSSTLVPGDTNGREDTYLYDRVLDQLELASLTDAGGIGEYDQRAAGVSDDGRYVLFISGSPAFVPGGPNPVGGRFRVFVRDRVTQRTTCVSVNTAGDLADNHSIDARISGDGRFVVFLSSARNLARDTDPYSDVFVRDLWMSTTTRLSVGPNGEHPTVGYEAPSVSGDGRAFGFAGQAGFFNEMGKSVYVVARRNAVTPLCFADSEPDAVGLCPCSNPGGARRGCANSSTAGAVLGCFGSVAPDQLRLTVTGLPAGSVALFVQGDAVEASGVPFGVGLRCAGGILLRLAARSIMGSGAMFPSPGEGTIHDTSSGLGVPLGAGTVSTYQVLYRDPGTTACGIQPWNASSALLVTW